MMCPYITFAAETEIIHSQIIEKDGQQTVEVHFERPVENGFDSARYIHPSHEWKSNHGFSEKDIAFFEKFL